MKIKLTNVFVVNKHLFKFLMYERRKQDFYEHYNVIK